MEKHYLGIDLGGTNTKLGIVNSKGKILQACSIETRSEDGPARWAERIRDAVIAWKLKFDFVGVGSPGPLDTKTGTILVTPNLITFEGFAMKSAFEKIFGKPVYFENDANSAALAEFYFGNFRGARDLVALTLGTGVGSGVIVNGKLLRGHGGFACEIGHMAIDWHPEAESLFDQGSLEAHVGAGRSLKSFHRLHPQIPIELTIKDHFDRARKADPLSSEFVSHWIRALGVGIYNVLVIFNPKVILLSGGVSGSWDLVKPKLFDFLKRSSYPELLNGTVIDISSLGDFFGVQGAAAVAMEQTGEL